VQAQWRESGVGRPAMRELDPYIHNLGKSLTICILVKRPNKY
jgi:hypothetical protein